MSGPTFTRLLVTALCLSFVLFIISIVRNKKSNGKENQHPWFTILCGAIFVFSLLLLIFV